MVYSTQGMEDENHMFPCH